MAKLEVACKRMASERQIPRRFKEGRLVPIPKGKGGQPKAHEPKADHDIENIVVGMGDKGDVRLAPPFQLRPKAPGSDAKVRFSGTFERSPAPSSPPLATRGRRAVGKVIDLQPRSSLTGTEAPDVTFQASLRYSP